MKNKKNNKKGFTLAELLIVVAIIAVLVAIAIPVFTAQLDKAKLATATANARSVTAEYVTGCIADAKTPSYSELNAKFTPAALGVDGATANAADGKVTVTYNSKTAEFAVDNDFS